jgi:inorganic triphosphatase YgiF
MALRVRQDRRRWIQTLKAPVAGQPGLQTFRELEGQVPSCQPILAKVGDRALAGELRRGIWPRLQPLFQTDIERTAWRLPFRGSEIELALDKGRIRAGDREEPVRELEIELKSGNRSALFEAAEEILQVVPFRLGHVTKAARGYALALGKDVGARKATIASLRQSNTVAEAVEKIVAECMIQMQANEAAILASGNAEAVHQFRVALRRLRAVIGTCRELIADPVRATWSTDLRWAQQAFGPARDYDVLMTETLDTMLPHVAKQPALSEFVAAAQAARAEARQEAIQALNDPRYAAMQLHIYRMLDSGEWRHAAARATLAMPVRGFAEAQLQARYKRLRRLGDRWRELNETELHRLRILGKKLRYVAMAFSSLFKGKVARRFGDRLVALQDCLGVLNDAYVGRQLAQQIVDRIDGEGTVPPAESRRIQGLIEGWHAHAIHIRLGDLEKVWTELAKAERFWRS